MCTFYALPPQAYHQGENFCHGGTFTALPDIPAAEISHCYYPAEIYRFLRQLSENCCGYETCMAADCDIDRYPMLNLSNLQYQIIKLARTAW